MDENKDYDLVLDRAKKQMDEMDPPTTEDMLFSCPPEEIQSRLMAPLEPTDVKISTPVTPPREEAYTAPAELVDLKRKDSVEIAEDLLTSTVQTIEGSVPLEGNDVVLEAPETPKVMPPPGLPVNDEHPITDSTRVNEMVKNESGSLSNVSREKSESNRRFDTSSITIEESAQFAVSRRVIDQPQIVHSEPIATKQMMVEKPLIETITVLPTYRSPLSSMGPSTEKMSTPIDSVSAGTASGVLSTENVERPKRRHPIVRQLIKLKKKFSSERTT